ncbi:MAG: ribose 5-phosphate isomerase [Gammaproteobacteria bacterium]|jgi:ribose 5-phosphate isomerase A|nr:ribose 5-phosphate isomerase [Gammaproteobacteria bacterium]
MSNDEFKQQAALAAINYLVEDSVIGIGTGSTVNYFIDALAAEKHRIQGTVASSKATRNRLKKHGIPVFDLTTVDEVPVYIDGADEVSPLLQMIKGGGGALTHEKIIATVAKKFVCIADESKYVKALGDFPVAVEVLPMARSYVARQLVSQLHADPVYREGFITDNGNIILDVYNLKLHEPIKTEMAINNITGVVDNGIFGKRSADVLLLATDSGVKTIKA